MRMGIIEIILNRDRRHKTYVHTNLSQKNLDVGYHASLPRKIHAPSEKTTCHFRNLIESHVKNIWEPYSQSYQKNSTHCYGGVLEI